MKLTLLASALALAASTAFAQTPTAAPAPASEATTSAAANHQAKRDARIEEHIKKLHDDLKITSAQEAEWSKVADTMRDNAQTLGKLFEQRHATRETASALDNLKSWSDIAQAQADGNKALIAAFQPLYESMPDAQKKIADQVFRGPMHGRHGPRHGHGKHHKDGNAKNAVKP